MIISFPPYRRPISRLILVFVLASLLFPLKAYVQKVDTVYASIEKMHSEIWRRFVNKQFKIIYDYTNPLGEVVIPTKQEVEQRKPNGLSYQTVIEDGAFYNGLYLDGLCERWKKLKTSQSAEEAKSIAKGLIKLATISKAPGFIARNILPDGITYYPASSDDQTFPWFYGMWKYLNSGLPDKNEYEQVRQLIINKAEALQRYNWDIPCDPIEFGFYGSFSKAGNKHLVRIPFITRIMFELTKDPHWKICYQKSLQEPPLGETSSRMELLAKGIPYGKPGENKYNFWLSASSQAAMKELFQLETDPILKSAYKFALKTNAVNAIIHMQLYCKFNNNSPLNYEVDWRYLNTFWKPQKDCWEARKLGLDQVGYSYTISPRGPHEFDYMTEPLFAAWVIVMSTEEHLVKPLLPELRKCLSHYEWSTIYHANMFIAESVYFEGLKYGL